MEFANELIDLVIEPVIISQLIRREKWRNFSAEGASRVASVNDFLLAACQGCDVNMSVWKHKGFWNPCNKVFRDDGIHLNDLGNYKLYRSFL